MNGGNGDFDFQLTCPKLADITYVIIRIPIIHQVHQEYIQTYI